MDGSVVVKIVGDASAVQPAVEETVTSLGGIDAALDSLGGWVDGIIQKFREMGVAGAAGGNEAAAGLERASAAADHAAASVGRMSERIHLGGLSFGFMERAMGPLMDGLLALFAVDAIAHWAESLGAAAEKTEQLAAKMGMTTSQVQALSGAATMSGTNIDVLARGLGLLDNKAVIAAGHSSTAAKALQSVGISANDGSTNMQRLLTVADKFKDMQDGPTKAALAMQLFGRSGREMIPFLNQGSVAIQQLMEKTKELGGVNAEAQAQGEQLASSVNESKVAWEGLKQTLTQAFGPLLTELVDGFIAMVGAMHDSYESGGIVKTIFDSLSAVFEGVIEIIQIVGEGFASIFSTGEGAINWSGMVKGAVTVIVGGFRILIATCVAVATGFKSAFFGIKGTIEQFIADWQTFKMQVQGVGDQLEVYMETLGKVFEDALTLHWGSITSDWDAGMAQVKGVVQKRANEILAVTGNLRKQAQADLAAAASISATGLAAADAIANGQGGGIKHDNFKFKFGGGGDDDTDITNPGKGGKGGQGGKGGSAKDDLVQSLEEELTAKKDAWAEEQLAQDTAQEFSLQSIADYWAKALQIAGLSAKDRQKIEEKYISAAQAVQKQEIQNKLDGYKEDLKQAGSNAAAKLKILEAEQAYIIKIYGAQSKEARAASDAVVQAKQDEAKQVREIQDEIYNNQQKLREMDIADAEAAAKFEVEMGRESKGKLLEQEKQFENQRYAIKQEALEKQKALIDPNRDPVQYQKICDQIEQLERQHQLKLNEIDRQAALERTQIERDALNSVAQSWSSALAKMATLQASFSTTLKSLWQGVQQAVEGAIQAVLNKFIAAELSKLVAVKGTGQATIATEAAKAGAGGVASMAAAPWPLDMTAPAFGASMASAAMAFSSISSAAGGDWNVGEGLYHLHNREMVLPAWAAEPLRNMIGGGAANFNAPPTANDSGAGGDVHLHFGTVIGSRSAMERWAQENRHMFGAGTRAYVRGGGSADPYRVR